MADEYNPEQQFDPNWLSPMDPRFMLNQAMPISGSYFAPKVQKPREYKDPNFFQYLYKLGNQIYKELDQQKIKYTFPNESELYFMFSPLDMVQNHRINLDLNYRY